MKPTTKNRAFQSAYRAGVYAAERGNPRTSCPYTDARGASGNVTFSRAFARYWLEGFDDSFAEGVKRLGKRRTTSEDSARNIESGPQPQEPFVNYPKPKPPGGSP